MTEQDLRELLKEAKMGQSGNGFYDSMVNKFVNLYNKATGKKKNKLHHDLKEGEVHAVFKDKSGALVPAKFAGPGSDTFGNLVDLVKKNKGSVQDALHPDNYVSDVDRVALLHDIRYDLYAGDAKKIREADLKFLEKVEEARKNEKHGNFNALPSYTGIKTKIVAEDTGLLDKDKFSGKKAKPIKQSREGLPEDIEGQAKLDLFKEVEGQLSKMGYGLHPLGKERPKRLKGGMDRPIIRENAIRRQRRLRPLRIEIDDEGEDIVDPVVVRIDKEISRLEEMKRERMSGGADKDRMVENLTDDLELMNINQTECQLCYQFPNSIQCKQCGTESCDTCAHSSGNKCPNCRNPINVNMKNVNPLSPLTLEEYERDVTERGEVGLSPSDQSNINTQINKRNEAVLDKLEIELQQLQRDIRIKEFEIPRITGILARRRIKNQLKTLRNAYEIKKEQRDKALQKYKANAFGGLTQ